MRVGRGTNIGHIGSHNLKVAREEKTGKMLIKLQEGYGEMSVVYGLSKLYSTNGRAPGTIVLATKCVQ